MNHLSLREAFEEIVTDCMSQFPNTPQDVIPLVDIYNQILLEWDFDILNYGVERQIAYYGDLINQHENGLRSIQNSTSIRNESQGDNQIFLLSALIRIERLIVETLKTSPDLEESINRRIKIRKDGEGHFWLLKWPEKFKLDKTYPHGCCDLTRSILHGLTFITDGPKWQTEFIDFFDKHPNSEIQNFTDQEGRYDPVKHKNHLIDEMDIFEGEASEYLIACLIEDVKVQALRSNQNTELRKFQRKVLPFLLEGIRPVQSATNASYFAQLENGLSGLSGIVERLQYLADFNVEFIEKPLDLIQGKEHEKGSIAYEGLRRRNKRELIDKLFPGIEIQSFVPLIIPKALFDKYLKGYELDPLYTFWFLEYNAKGYFENNLLEGLKRELASPLAESCIKRELNIMAKLEREATELSENETEKENISIDPKLHKKYPKSHLYPNEIEFLRIKGEYYKTNFLPNVNVGGIIAVETYARYKLLKPFLENELYRLGVKTTNTEETEGQLLRIAKPVFDPDSTQVIFSLLKGFFSIEDQHRLRQLLKGTDDITEHLVFLDSGSRLGNTFKQLKKKDFITGCNQKELEIWVQKSFKYKTPKGIKDFSANYLNDLISTDKPTCKNPIIKIVEAESGYCIEKA